MKQALHIFRKDARRLWPQIALVAVLFAVYATLSPETTLSGAVSVLDWGGIPPVLIVLACWTLGASVMHEDAAAEENPFWLTRPYSRRSLVVAKTLFLFAFVFVPLVFCGAILEARGGVGIAANIGSLLALCFLRSVWLILPALALGAITRNLMEFAGALCGLAVILAVSEARSEWLSFLLSGFRQSGNIAAILPMVVAALTIIGLQYAARRTWWNRGILLAGVIGSGLLIPMSSVALFSLRAMNPGFDPNSIRVSFDRGAPVESIRGTLGCLSVPLRVEGLPAKTALRPIEAVAELSYPHDATKKVDAQVEQAAEGDREIICQGMRMTLDAPTLRTTIHFAVVEVSPIASIPARHGALSAGDAGRCEIVEDVNSQLRCTVAEPPGGTVTAQLEYPGYQLFAKALRSDSAMRLSPVLRQKFDGTTRTNPGGWDFDHALRSTDARFVLRNERIIGSFRAQLVYEDFQYQWWIPPPVKSK